ncbi:hypothetical protein EB796_021409 [Bugula neritina]|uniref:Uncharacterized protein n=1 Tax=Bugula neritina TaxID=10212 RepID=A0A7J7J4D2_BUGNE|nr:hypothetical protein EB796_021409 [Bugula neritina]
MRQYWSVSSIAVAFLALLCILTASTQAISSNDGAAEVGAYLDDASYEEMLPPEKRGMPISEFIMRKLQKEKPRCSSWNGHCQPNRRGDCCSPYFCKCMLIFSNRCRCVL